MPIFECSRCNEMTYSAFPGALATCAHCGSERQRVIDGNFDEARRSHRTLGPGDHAALVCEDPATVASFCAQFLADGVSAGEHVIAGLHGDLHHAVSALLEPDVELSIEWEEPNSLYGDFDADRIASTYEALIAAESRTTRILAALDGECVGDVDPDDLTRYEKLAHAIITARGANVLCIYDARSLPPELVEVGELRHGLLVEDGRARRNEQFEYQPA